MKQLFFLLIVMLSMTLTCCGGFDSDPIEPNILGVSNVQYDSKSELWFVVIDSTQYAIAKVVIADNNPRSYSKTQGIEPVEGMLVTVFTSPRMTGVQAVSGKQSVAEIEELYHTNSLGAFILFGVVFLCGALIVFLPNTRKVKVVHADL